MECATAWYWTFLKPTSSNEPACRCATRYACPSKSTFGCGAHLCVFACSACPFGCQRGLRGQLKLTTTDFKKYQDARSKLAAQWAAVSLACRVSRVWTLTDLKGPTAFYAGTALISQHNAAWLQIRSWSIGSGSGVNRTPLPAISTPKPKQP